LLRSAAVREPTFSVCVTLVALHLATLALPLPGSVSPLVRMVMLVCAVLGAPVLVVWFSQRGRASRVLAAGFVGLVATVAGLATSVPHAVLAGPGGADYTGIVATAAGIGLIGLAFRDAIRGRRPAVKLAVAIPAAFVIAQWLIAPAINVGIITNAPRAVAADAATLGFAGARDVSFAASDGIRLDGWYVPGRNGAEVILLHGSHGTRTDTLAHLRLLHAAGYGVLAFDARGHGQSQGETNALGWSGARDVAGAVSFLKRQPGVDPQRIAALGLSMGAEEALRAAATGIPLAAVVADGAGASTLSDDQLLPHGLSPVFTSVTWLTMRCTELVSGESEPAGLGRTAGRIRVPVLLIASNASGERTIDQIYRRRIGRDATLWYLPDAGHTGGLSTHPAQYAPRIESFLASALRVQQPESPNLGAPSRRLMLLAAR
jgi:pimeloyl-ACP methyl ester carboxylesterase